MGSFGEIERNQLANIVMICDAIIIIWFIVYTFLLNRWINAEKQASEKMNVEMTDFACRIKRLPHIESMD